MMENGGWSPHTEEEEEEEEERDTIYTIYTIALLCSRRVSTFMYSSETQYIALCYTLVISGAQDHIHECTHCNT